MAGRELILLIGFMFANANGAESAVAQDGAPKQATKHKTAQGSAPSTGDTKISAGDESPAGEGLQQTSDTSGSWLFEDQRAIWTSPGRIRTGDAQWLVPAAGVAAAFFATDKNLSRSLSSAPASLNRSSNIRTASVAGLGAATAGLYLWSLQSHDPHQRETGVLAGEAIVDSLLATEAMKFVVARERPRAGSGQGQFFSDGGSFPSAHAAGAWAAAGILAHEYPGPLTKLVAYGLASTVSITSVTSKQHFASDVLVGSAVGWLVSEYVYRRRHDPQLGGSAWESLPSQVRTSVLYSNHPGSSYLPLDSWVYPAFERLAALGLVNTAFMGTRPWSRRQCRQLLEEVDERSLLRSSTDFQTQDLLLALRRELFDENDSRFAENRSLEVESVYARVLSASGNVLNEGYHFGQTYAYDFGRPFRRGTNVISGSSFSASYGNLFFHFAGEFEHSPAEPGLTASEASFIAERDRVSPPTAAPFASVNQFKFLDAYAGMNLGGWQFSFGNQSLSWGPGPGGSLLLSDNAAPFPMLRIASDEPIDMPGISKIFGPFHMEQFYGRLSGHRGLSQPWIYGQKVSFRPLRSLEFAYGRTTLIGGTGHPLTSGSFFESLVGRVDSARNTVPGDSRTAVDWTWQIPKVHDRVSFYGELTSDDDPIPFQNLSKAMVRPGIYFPRLPLLPKWDFHFEWTSSTTPGRGPLQDHGALNYWNLDYTSGYTNSGGLLGNTVGREGITLQAWTRFWISPRRTLDISWKQSRVLADYVPGGGKWQDYQAAYSFTQSSGWYAKGLLQVEHISSFPLLFQGPRNNVVASVEVGFLPRWARHAQTRRPSAESAATASGPLHQEVAR